LAGTVHVRLNKMEEAGIIKGVRSFNLRYVKLGYSFIAYVWYFLGKKHIKPNLFRAFGIKFQNVLWPILRRENSNIFCKMRAKDTNHAKKTSIFKIDDIGWDKQNRNYDFIKKKSINDLKTLCILFFK